MQGPQPKLVGIALAAISVVLFAVSLLWPTLLVLPIVAIIALALGCVMVGAGTRPLGSVQLGAVPGAGLYLALGVIWVVAWNNVFRFRGNIELLAVDELTSFVVTVLVWPWQLLGTVRDLLN